jgi:hypothetical protein
MCVHTNLSCGARTRAVVVVGFLFSPAFGFYDPSCRMGGGALGRTEDREE